MTTLKRGGFVHGLGHKGHKPGEATQTFLDSLHDMYRQTGRAILHRTSAGAEWGKGGSIHVRKGMVDYVGVTGFGLNGRAIALEAKETEHPKGLRRSALARHQRVQLVEWAEMGAVSAVFVGRKMGYGLRYYLYPIDCERPMPALVPWGDMYALPDGDWLRVVEDRREPW